MISATLHHFETFLAVAESGSFTAAAQKISHSKASVSQTIKALETSLNVSLFIRNTRQVKLTDEGKLLFTQCQRLKNELDTARDLITGFNSEPSGTLRISCNPYFAEFHLLEILQKYINHFPKVKIEILSEERIPNMQAEQIDIVFGVNWSAPDDVVARGIAKTRYVLCASKEYLKKNGTPKSIKELEQHNYIPHLGRTPKNIISNLKNDISINLDPNMAVNNAHLMKKCAQLGLGIVQLHDYIVQEELDNGSLVEILKDQLKPDIPLYIYYQKHRFVQPKIRQFVNLVTGMNS